MITFFKITKLCNTFLKLLLLLLKRQCTVQLLQCLPSLAVRVIAAIIFKEIGGDACCLTHLCMLGSQFSFIVLHQLNYFKKT